jgi:hypothetical protein
MHCAAAALAWWMVSCFQFKLVSKTSCTVPLHRLLGGWLIIPKVQISFQGLISFQNIMHRAAAPLARWMVDHSQSS